ncbi:MAG: BlaI/MecI/CopY family transcriptional regulator [Microcoleaceae cyanobacterium]
MASLPNYRPKKLSVGPLEQEILNIVWELNGATAKRVHQYILADPDRELSYPSVTTVLQRLTQKGWLACDKSDRAFVWKPLLSQQEAQLLKAHDRLNQFLEVTNPDMVAAFADRLDHGSLDQLEAIAQRIQAIRQARQEEE